VRQRIVHLTLCLLALLATSTIAMAQTAPAASGSSYVVRFDHWTDRDERDFSEFISAIGQSNCRTVDECLHGVGNPFRASDPPGIRFTSDCANLPYVLRAYFAWKRGLPFSYASAVSPRGSAADIRYSANGNQITARTDVTTGSTSGYALLSALLAATSSATYRVHPALEQPREPDFYAAAISAKSIKPGTVIYDPDGHVAVVYHVERDGRIQFMDAHPDNLLTRGYYDLRFVRGPPGVGAGFKNWRPLKLVGYTRRGDGALVGGHAVLASNAEIPDFSDEQFYGNGPRAGDSGWANGTFSSNNEPMDYYDWVRARLSGGKLQIEPVAELGDMVNAICADLHDRQQAVDLSLAAGMQNKSEPSRLPPNIYGTEGDWETYSTPSRDARLKTSFKEVRDKAQRFVEMYRSGDSHLVYAGSDLVADLAATYEHQSGQCSITYARTDGSKITLSYEDLRKRLFQLSFDPYQCVERRWGASDPSELSTCRDGELKQAWYAAEQNLRNQIDRTYEARMDFTLEQLKVPGPGKGVPTPPDTDVRAYLGSVTGTQRGATPATTVAAADPPPVPTLSMEKPNLDEWRQKRAAAFAQWQASHSPREIWDAPDAPPMTMVPAGSFVMGSPSSEPGHWPAEGPQHRVTIGSAFAVSTYPVTFDEWDACVADGGCNGYTPFDERWGRGRHPAINISWDDAQAYVAWLSAKTGRRYRLLSEAEFEYAARAGSTTPYPFGSAISPAQANYIDAAGGDGDQGKRPMPVGSFPPNGFGLYDMQGNVWQWVADCWNNDYSRAPADGSVWRSGDCQRRVVRGGAFNRDKNFLRSAFRYWIVPQLRSALAGFRVARSL
jgi:formylglycine-generating enzyme required for sulfatase activity